MRAHLTRFFLRQYIEHKSAANLRVHVVSNAVLWTALVTVLSQVWVPFFVPGFGANLGALFVVGSVAYWMALDPLVPLLVLAWSFFWANVPFVPWGPGHGWVAGVLLPLAVLTAAGLAAYFAHVYHHEHAPYLATDDRRADAIETAHAVLWGPFHFWLAALLADGYRPALRDALDTAERRRILRMNRVAWRNWGGTAHCSPQMVCVPLSLDDLADVVRETAREGRGVRVVGSGYTWARWVPTDDTLIFCERLSRVEVDLSDPSRPAVWAECGATNRQVNAALAAAGLQLPYNVALETARVAGIVSVGSHGSGKDTATMGDLVLALDVVDATGARRILSEETIGAEGMAAARVGFGIFGVIARVRLRVEPASLVLQIDRKVPLDAALAEVASLVRAKDSVELSWFPLNDWVWVRTLERTARPPTRRPSRLVSGAAGIARMLLAQGFAAIAGPAPFLVPWIRRRTSWTRSFQERVLPLAEAVHFRRWIEGTKCSSIEIGFKADEDLANARAAFRGTVSCVQAWAARSRYPIDLAVNLRFTGPSEALLSPSYGPGLTCFVEALSMGRTPDWEAVSAELFGAWMADPTALPHWAKEFEHVPGLVEFLRSRLGERRERFAAAWRATGVDPGERFVNALVRRMFLDPEA